MSILASLPQQQFTPQTVSIPFAVGSPSPKSLFAKVTRVGWPASGVVAKATLTWANGEKSAATFIGDGSTPAFAGSDVPAGQTSGTVDVVVLQTCTAAVTVESFP